MLKIEDVVKLYEFVDIKLNYFKQEHCCKAFFEGRTVRVFMKNIDSEKDLELTLIHELIHARNWYLLDVEDDEDEVEDEAVVTYNNNHEIVKFIKQLYCPRLK